MRRKRGGGGGGAEIEAFPATDLSIGAKDTQQVPVYATTKRPIDIEPDNNP